MEGELWKSMAGVVWFHRVLVSLQGIRQSHRHSTLVGFVLQPSRTATTPLRERAARDEALFTGAMRRSQLARGRRAADQNGSTAGGPANLWARFGARSAGARGGEVGRAAW